MTEKQYVRIVDHSEKEVQIFDTINEKKIFNIFFNELDSAICLNGALTDTVDLLNTLNETNRKQSEIIDWLIGALRDDDEIFKEKSISYVINNTLSDLVNGKISVDELLEEWDND